MKDTGVFFGSRTYFLVMHANRCFERADFALLYQTKKIFVNPLKIVDWQQRDNT